MTIKTLLKKYIRSTRSISKRNAFRPICNTIIYICVCVCNMIQINETDIEINKKSEQYEKLMITKEYNLVQYIL